MGLYKVSIFYAYLVNVQVNSVFECYTELLGEAKGYVNLPLLKAFGWASSRKLCVG